MNKNSKYILMAALVLVILGGAMYAANISRNKFAEVTGTSEQTKTESNQQQSIEMNNNETAKSPDQDTSQGQVGKNIKQNDKSMEQNTQSTQTSGLKKEILKEGTGIVSKAGDTVQVHYTGLLENGSKFDSSLDRGVPFSFQLGAGMVIKGWDEGVAGMKVGEKVKLTIPASMGYGANGHPPVIPGNATLIFEIELLKIN